jgi:hypothetical protein
MRIGIVVALLCGGVASAGERRLHAASVEASSFLFNDWNKFQENYHPLYAADDDPATAWVEGAPGSGAGQWLRVKVTPMTGATQVRLRIRNGYQKTPKLFEANARAKEVTIKLSPGGQTSKHTLTDAQNWQELAVTLPAGKLDALELKVDSVYPGKKYEDLCISDVQVFVSAATADNPAFEKARFDKIVAWKSERMSAAKLFKDASAKKFPLAPQYHITEVGSAPEGRAKCKWDDALCQMTSALGTLHKESAVSAHAPAIAAALQAVSTQLKGWVPVQAVALDKRPVPRIDGICTPSLESCDGGGCYGMVELPLGGTVGFLNANQVATFDAAAQAPLAEVLAKKPAECRHADSGKMFGWALRETAESGKARVKALFLVRCGAVESREGREPSVMPQLLVYDAAGQLEVMAGTSYASAVEWKPTSDGPRVAGAYRMGTYDAPRRLEAATEVAAK